MDNKNLKREEFIEKYSQNSKKVLQIINEKKEKNNSSEDKYIDGDEKC